MRRWTLAYAPAFSCFYKKHLYFTIPGKSLQVLVLSESIDETTMLEELVRIRSALEKKPAPSLSPPKGLVDEFIQFLNKYGIIGLAVAFIMGGAVNKLVSALVNYIVMPMITPFIPGGSWRDALLYLEPIELQVGQFAGALLDFLIIAIVVFSLMKQLQKTSVR